VGQYFKQVFPDQFIQLVGGNVPSRTAFVEMSVNNIRFSPTDVIMTPGRSLAGETSEVTDATTHQSSQQVLVGGIIPAGDLFIMRQLSLYLFKLLWFNDGGNGCHRDPFALRNLGAAMAWLTGRMQRRTTLMRLGRTSAPHINSTRVRRVRQDAPYTGCIPKLTSSRRGNAHLMQMFGQTVKCGIFLQVIGKHLAHNRRFCFVYSDFGRIPGTFWLRLIPKGPLPPRKQDSSSIFDLTSTAHPVGNQGTFILRNRPTNLQNQLVMGILAHGTFQKFNPATVPFQFFQQQHLVNVVPSQAVWGCHRNTVNFSGGDPIPQPVQTWSVEGCPAETIIPKNVLLWQFPPLLTDIGSQPFQLLFNRLSLCLALSRYPGINRYPHVVPPGLSASGSFRRNELSPAPTDRPDPTGFARLGTPAPSGKFSTGVSWLPPHSDSSDAEYTLSSVAGMRNRNGRRDQFSGKHPVRVMQNLSFVSRPLKKTFWMTNQPVSRSSPVKSAMRPCSLA
jgi:hypothetical protein